MEKLTFTVCIRITNDNNNVTNKYITMKVPFKFLTSTQQRQAIDNAIRLSDTSYLAFLIGRDCLFLESMFSWSESIEGNDYWRAISNKYVESLQSDLEELADKFHGVTSSTLVDDHGRPYEATENGKIYLSRKTIFEYSIKN